MLISPLSISGWMNCFTSSAVCRLKAWLISIGEITGWRVMSRRNDSVVTSGKFDDMEPPVS